VAFGSSKSGQMMSQNEVASVLRDLNQGSRIKSDWKPLGEMLRSEVQLAFLALMCCETALPQGGQVTIDRDAAGWSLVAQGPKIAADQAKWDYLNGAATLELAANIVQFPMLRLLSDESDKKILVTPSDTTLTLKIA
jgi:histidine phosphotransferase ChpT